MTSVGMLHSSNIAMEYKLSFTKNHIPCRGLLIKHLTRPWTSVEGRVSGGEGWSVVANYYGRSRAYVSFQVRLSPEMKVRLEQRSFESGLSQVAIINAALEYYLAHVPVNDDDPEKPQGDREKDGPS